MVMWPLQRYRLSKFIDQLGLIAYYEDDEAMIRPSKWNNNHRKHGLDCMGQVGLLRTKSALVQQQAARSLASVERDVVAFVQQVEHHTYIDILYVHVH
jgi:hypothetical protein